jgi:hypothetical protein
MTLENVNDYIEANLVHSIHVSERRSFRGCRRRWNWVYRDLWYPYVTAKPLEFGIAFHKAEEYWYDPEFWNVPPIEARQEETLAVFRKACKEQLTEYKDRVKAGLVEQYLTDEEVEADYKERVRLGVGMLKETFKQSAELDHENFRPRGVEVTFEVPILKDSALQGVQKDFTKYPLHAFMWCKCDRCKRKWQASEAGKAEMQVCREKHAYFHRVVKVPFHEEEHFAYCWKGLPVTLGGRIDMLAEDVYGRYWIYDWKTAARLSTGEPGAPDDYLWLDDQITSYCWALWSMGVDVAGFIYHEQKKALPEEPEPLKRQYRQCWYSQNKQKAYSYEVYKRTVEENDPEAYRAGLYDDFLEHLRTEGGVYYKRHQIHRNQHELEEAGRNIALEAAEMTDPNLRIYPSPGRFGCNFCAFREPCLGQNRGEDYQYTLESSFEKREKLYYETALPSTDKPERL